MRIVTSLVLCVFAAVGVCGQTPAREIAVTVDDLPAVTDGGLAQMREITSKLLDAFRRHNVPAVGFVNEGRFYVRGEMDARTELLRAWLDAGHELGNHTFSHISIDRHPLAEYQETSSAARS